MHPSYCGHHGGTEIESRGNLEDLGWRKDKQGGRKLCPKPWRWPPTLGGRVRTAKAAPAGYSGLGTVPQPF